METHQLVSGADPEVALYDGIAFYESGDIYNALSCWKELLRHIPEHEVAQRYVEFVQGYLGINENASEQEVNTALRRESNKLRGEQAVAAEAAPVAQGTQAFDPSNIPESVGVSSEEPPPPDSIRVRRGGAPAVTATNLAAGFMIDEVESAEDLIEEEMVTRKPHEVMPETILASDDMSSASNAVVPAERPVVQMAESSTIAKEALSGDAGPRTQADGLTVQALSRQLADYHRSGKYEEAVTTAKQLLTQDPKHAVARRYIDEYHRQKQAALQAALRKQKSSSSIETKTQGAVEAHAAKPQSLPSAEEIAAEEAQTTAPSKQSAVDESPVEVITDFTQKPRVKMQPDQISWSAFDHRAGFFMSQVDGNTSYEDLIVISAMPREQAIDILSQLITNGVIG